jgi:hypothetical protein
MADLFETTHAEMEEFISACLSLIHVPPSLATLLHAKSALKTLVSEILMKEHISTQCINFINYLLDIFFEMLETPNPKPFSKKIIITSSPAFALYATAAEFKDESTPLYRRSCLILRWAIEKVLAPHDVAKKTKDDYLLALRILFKFTPDQIRYHQSLQPVDVRTLIDEALSCYIKSDENYTMTTRAKIIKSKLYNLLLSNKAIVSHPHDGPPKNQLPGTTTTISITETCDETGKVANYGDASESDEIKYSELMLKEDLVDLYAHDNTLPTGPDIVPGPPRIRMTFYDTISLRANLFYFDSRFPGLHHLSLLLIVIQDRWEVSSRKEKLIMTFLLLLMMTGVSPEEALSSRTHPEAEAAPDFTKHKLLITRIDGHFYIIRDKIISYKRPPAGSENCRKPLDIIWVRLHDSLAPCLEEVWNDRRNIGCFFSTIEPFSGRAFTINTVNEFLKKNINARFALNLTAHKITSSFFPLFYGRYGLDAICACYVSGQDLRLFKSQLHYIYVDACKVCKEYLKATDEVLSSLRKNNDVARTKILEVKSTGMLSTAPFLLMEPEEGSRAHVAPPSIAGGVGYGSGIVPTAADLKLYIVKLGGIIEALKMEDIIIRHNLFTVYTYLCAQLNFALRPRNDLPFSEDIFCRHDYEVINDKMSCRFYEDRVLPGSAVLKALCQSRCSGFPDVQRYISEILNPSIVEEDPNLFFFFISARGKLKPFSLRRAKECLIKGGVPFPFNWKSPRHFVRTFLYENNIYNEFGDVWLGHHRISREPLGFASSLQYKKVKEIGLDIVNQMLKEIGFKHLSYLPDEEKNG